MILNVHLTSVGRMREDASSRLRRGNLAGVISLE